MKSTWKRIAVIALAVLLLLLGLISLILPLSPGLLFLALSIALFSVVSPEIRAFIERRTRRFPKLHAAVKRLEARVVRWVGEV